MALQVAVVAHGGCLKTVYLVPFTKLETEVRKGVARPS